MDAPRDAKEFYGQTLAKAPQELRTFYEALTEQDSAKLRSVLADDFDYKSAMMAFDKPDDFVASVSGFGGWVETSQCIVDGDQVAHTMMFHMTAPAQADIPGCDVFQLANGRIQSVTTYNNPADFPGSPAG